MSVARNKTESGKHFENHRSEFHAHNINALYDSAYLILFLSLFSIFSLFIYLFFIYLWASPETRLRAASISRITGVNFMLTISIHFAMVQTVYLFPFFSPFFFFNFYFSLFFLFTCERRRKQDWERQAFQESQEWISCSQYQCTLLWCVRYQDCSPLAQYPWMPITKYNLINFN